MGISVLRSWTDTDAPELFQNVKGSMVQLLKTVLVDGYGTGEDEKPALGWELYDADSETHTDITKMVLKNTAGTGTYAMFNGDCLEETNSTYRYFKTFVRACESVESYDSGLGQSPPTSLTPGGYIKHGYTTRYDTAVPWHVIGNGKSFWVITKSNYNQFPTSEPFYRDSWFPHFIGDYSPVHTYNKFNFITCLEVQSASTSPGWCYSRNSTYLASYGLRGLSWAPGGTHCPIYSGDVAGGDQAFYSASFGSYHSDEHPKRLNRMYISSSSHLMGILPGILSLQARQASTVLLDKTVEADDYDLLYLATSFSSATTYGYFIFIVGKGYDNDI